MISRSKAVLLASAAAVAFASPAFAETPAAPTESGANDQSRGEIVVTAQKREQRLLDVPQSVSVLSAQALSDVHAERFADYFNRIPSANIVESQAGQARLVLRGINSGGVGATVATYVDETPYGSATSLANGAVLAPDIDPFDLARVEVLRGPQGTLYGANSLGGLVKYVTIAPQTDAFHMAAEVGGESLAHGDAGVSGRAAFNVPLSDDMAVRASGFYRKDPGYIDEPNGGADINGGKTYGGRFSAIFKPTTRLTIRATAFLENLNSDGSSTEDVDPVTLDPVTGALTQSRIVEQPNKMRYRIYNGTLDYDLGGVQLLSSSSWGTLDQSTVQDASGLYGGLLTSIFGIPLGADVVQSLSQRRFTQEVRLASSHTKLLEWTIGGFYTRERNNLLQALNAVDGTSGALNTALSPLETVVLPSTYREYAGFANATVHLTNQFNVTFGARYSHNKQTVSETTDGPLVGGATTITGGSSDHAFTYSIAPEYKPNDRTTFYLRLAKGYQPGGPNVLPPLAPDSVPRVFGPSTTLNYEAGVKAELIDRLLTVELTGFDIEWSHIQLLADIGGFGVNTNGGKAKSSGVELSTTLTPTRELSLSLNGAYVNAHLTEDAPDIVGGKDGDPLPFNAHWAGTVSADYSTPLTDTTDGSFGFSWRYTGKRETNFDTTYGQHELKAYGQLDAHAGVSFDKMRIDLFVRNLTDSRGITDLGTAGSALNGAISAGVVRPRSAGLSIGYRY
ncbi:MAG TPA: TonB-dependent receptor [Sphingomonas sp.]|uniref:TonB-dependent receptor n=1 Tax=Sphingomonas sp. TaxID=28214 RepID=UPI002D13790D|nr:TonB-dependent receptor [Sphingomonas sp.]HMI19539.1 TonB-dependent receptor [Sphingomonas sp.]